MGKLKQNMLDFLEATDQFDIDSEDGYSEEYLTAIGECMKFQRGAEVTYPIPKLDFSEEESAE